MWLEAKDIQLKQLLKKLDQKYYKFFKITKEIEQVSYTDPNTSKLSDSYHRQHLLNIYFTQNIYRSRYLFSNIYTFVQYGLIWPHFLADHSIIKYITFW